jgi:hypothetical protein
MSVDKFKFVSPGVFIDEIDESGIPALPERMGPLVIGRFKKGPSNRPTKVTSYKEFVQIFGDPAPGNASGDIWRTGEMTAPTYAAYAVKAWLRNNSPCTVYRVLGEASPRASSDDEATNGLAQAGWKTKQDFDTNISSSGGAYGLFVFPSGSNTTHVTGTLAAVWYFNDGAIVLTGTHKPSAGAQAVRGAGVLVDSTAGEMKFTAQILKDGGVRGANVGPIPSAANNDAVQRTVTFNFNRDSDLFIRRVFNTDPTKTNSFATSTTSDYWLGETFESNLRFSENPLLSSHQGTAATTNTAQDSDNFFGVILALDNTNDGDSDTANVLWHNRAQDARAAQTGWFISQDTRGSTTASFHPVNDTEELFKFHALDSGEQANRDYKISITNIKVPTDNFNKFGTFNVLVRKATDLDQAPQILERFSGVNLDPTSANYIKRVIGDRYYSYDEDNKRIIEHGDDDNRSQIVRVEVSDRVSAGTADGLNPFGVYGPSVQRTHEINSTTTGATVLVAGSGSANALPSGTLPHVWNEGLLAGRLLLGSGSSGFAPGGTHEFTGSIVMPRTRLRTSSSEGGLVLASKAYFGYQSNIKNTRRYDQTNLDILRGQPANLDPTGEPSDLLQYSWVFTLDDVGEAPDDKSHAIWQSGSRAGTILPQTAGDGANEIRISASFTAASASGDSNGVPLVLSKGFDKFTSPMFGGFDGYNITEQDNFRNSKMSSPTEQNNSAFYSLKKAIDITSDTDFIEYDVAVMPGITNTTLTTQLVNSCEERADALALIDIEGGYKPPHERTTSETSDDALGSVTTAVNNLKDLNINSSYGCTFYPWVKIRDTFADAVLYVPPSVVALGTFSSSQRKSAVWFAPAGFTRGGLSEGSAGLPVLGVRRRLTSTERDKLYDANINPIASFPAEGVVVFGQKTLQVTPSALDRINVRRLLIYLKKEISRIASRVLFDQNVQSTWDRFTGEVIPFLEGVQAGLGLVDFKVLLDDTTTTPDLVDRNILYAKIFLKPARAIEFIALDFIITRSGASFDD